MLSERIQVFFRRRSVVVVVVVFSSPIIINQNMVTRDCCFDADVAARFWQLVVMLVDATGACLSDEMEQSFPPKTVFLSFCYFPRIF